MSKRKCEECGKPLGSTYNKCHECGGKSKRAGQATTPHQWQIMYGVKPENLKTCDIQGRDYDFNDRGQEARFDPEEFYGTSNTDTEEEGEE